MKKNYIFLWLLLFCEQLFAQNKGMIPVGKQLPAGTERRLALVIGNKNYAYAGRLNNTHNDADDMARVLQNLGFDVILKKDLSMVDFLKAIDDFGTKLGQYNVGLLYYSGHGIQYQGENYLVPIDAKANTAEDIEYTCVKLGRAMAKMEGAKLKVSLAFLDACRNNPFPSSKRVVGQGLTIPNNPPGSFVAFSTRAGSTADDNSSGRNGLFTSALLQNLPQANVGLRTMIDNVIETVAQRSGNSQIPGRYDELRGDFYFLVGEKDIPPINEKELTFAYNLKPLLYKINFGASINDVFNFEHGINYTMPYENLPTATECGNQNVKYYWRYLKDTRMKDDIYAFLAARGLKEKISNDSYLLYFFKDNKLAKVSLRLYPLSQDANKLITNAIGAQAERYETALNGIHYISGASFTDVPSCELIICNEIGYNFCIHDWWYK